MNLECKNAQVNMYWDDDKMLELVIRNQHGDILLVQTQGAKGIMTNIHNESEWGDKNAKEI